MVEHVQAGTLIVGEGVVIKGSFAVPDMALVAGLVEGELTTREVQIQASGVINGKVRAQFVDVHGEVTQGLSVSTHLIIRSTGRVSGTIEYKEITVEKGAKITGDLKVMAGSPY
jgi:cytoskeletal protein CcmA (bactofilin family)